MSAQKTYIVSFSGGRDSAAVAIWFCKNPPADMTAAHFVFSDTGIEPQSVYRFLDDMEARIIKPAGFTLSRISRAHEGYETAWDSIYDRHGKVTKGKNAGQDAKPCMPGPVMRSCTERLKIRPIRLWRRDTLGRAPVTWVIGFRADEGDADRRRVETKALQKNGDVIWQPFMELGIDLAGVRKIIADAGMKEPAFYNWTTRSGCALCFYKPLRDIIKAKAFEPANFEKMAVLEDKAIAAHGRRASPYVLIYKMTLREIVQANPEQIAAAEKLALDERKCGDPLASCVL